MESNILVSNQSTIITGVVYPNAKPSRITGDDKPFFAFAFDVWRDEDANLHTERIYVRQFSISLEKAWEYGQRVKPYMVIAARVVITDADSAQLIELLDTSVPESDELFLFATELRQPVSIQHERFGTLTLDREYGWYEGHTAWMGTPTRIAFEYFNELAHKSDLESALNIADVLWDDQARWNQRIQDYAVQRLLPIKNEHWLDDDEQGNEEPPLTAEDFKSHITLKTISISSDGHFGFWHDDGYMFFGHSVWVTGNLTDGPTRADIPG